MENVDYEKLHMHFIFFESDLCNSIFHKLFGLPSNSGDDREQLKIINQ